MRYASRICLLVTLLLLAAGNGITEEAGDSGFSMQIADVFKIANGGLVVTGTIETGEINVGDTLCLHSEDSGTRTVTIDGIEMFRKLLQSAKAGESVGLLISGVDKRQVAKGDSLTAGC